MGIITPVDCKTTMSQTHETAHITHYPPNVLRCLGKIYQEYNDIFDNKLVPANKKRDTDYRYARNQKGNFFNPFVQIDMAALPQSLLIKMADMADEEVITILRASIFEIENSIAMYGLLANIGSRQGTNNWGSYFRSGLQNIRELHKKPVYLLAVTEDKYEAMLGSEFGFTGAGSIDDATVRSVSGFDGMIGPKQFKEHFADWQKNGNTPLFFTRTSAPVANLRDPDLARPDSLLNDAEILAMIKEHTITFNVDEEGAQPINDTKRYLATMGMGVNINNMQDMASIEVRAWLAARGVELPKQMVDVTSLNPESFKQIWNTHGKGPTHFGLPTKGFGIRGKPMEDSYGCYGHAVPGSDFYRILRDGLSKRGPYVLQPEIPLMRTQDGNTGTTYSTIDRMFFMKNPHTGEIQYMDGFRSCMPTGTPEEKQGRNHGNESTVWGLVKAQK